MIIPPEKFALKEPLQEDIELFENKIFQDKILYEKESIFHKISVVENEIGKFLKFDDCTYQAGFISHDFYSGNIPYINYFLLPVLQNPDMKNILLVGLGTGKVVKDFENLLPNLKHIDIVDIDPEITSIATDYFDFKQSDKTQIHIQDGRVFIRESKNKYDLIIVDVAGDEGVPYRFMTEDFFVETKNALAENGCFVLNSFGSYLLDKEENVVPRCVLKSLEDVFSDISTFCCNYSDEIFYKTFYDKDYRLIDITNIIYFASNGQMFDNICEKAQEKASMFDNIGVLNIEQYAKDLYKKKINTKNIKSLKDEFENDPFFTLENFKDFVTNV